MVAYFVGHLDLEGLSPSTIQSLVTGIGFFHKINNLPNPSDSYLVKRALVGAKKKAPPPTQAHPIQKDLLHTMCKLVLDLITPRYDATLIRTMLLFGYHGCLRFGEMGNSNGVKHALNIDNVKLGHDGKIGWVTFVLETYKGSKDPVSFKIVQEPESVHCPVTALVEYLGLRGGRSGTLFIRENGKPVSRDFFAQKVKFLVGKAGLDPSRYNTHSLRAGRATDLAISGTPDAIIKQTGRWLSNAFEKYVRFNSFVLPGC